MRLAFNIEGKLTATGDAADAYTTDDEFVVVDHDSDFQLWRYTYDRENGAVVVQYPLLSDEDALAQLETDARSE